VSGVRRALPTGMTHDTTTRARRGRWIAWGILLLCAGLLALRFRHHTCDDAFISFRYARNLVEGHGLVFNPGERVEGYTNFLWVLLSAIPIALGHGPVGFSRAVGFAAHLAALAGVFCAARRLTSRPPLAFAGALLYALSPAATVWAMAGLETPLFTTLLTWGVFFSLRGTREEAGPARLPVAAALLIAAATLTRPEGLLVAVAVAAALPARQRLGFLGIVVAALLPWLVWRTAYYGDLLPNTFHAKVGMSAAQIVRGARYYLAFLVECGSWTIASIALGLLAARRRLTARILLAVVLPFLGYIVAIGGDFMPMYRFFAPITGLLALLLVDGLDAFLDRRATAPRATVAAAVAIAIVWALICVRPAFMGGSFDYVRQDQREVETWRAIGLWFRDHAAGGSSIALVPAGAVPFYSRLETIDLLGLNDRTIARRPVEKPGAAPAGHERSDAAYVLARRPTYVLLGTYSLSPDPPDASTVLPLYYQAEKEITASPGFRNGYRLRAGHCPGGYFTYFESQESAPSVAPRDTVRGD
jgi:hypothetical protein